MTENTSAIFKAIRKFHGLMQAEMATILGVTQGTISKIEAGELAPELNLWFKFISVFHIKDPYSFEYGAIELESLNNIDVSKFDSPLLPKHPFKVSYFNDKKYFISKDIRPIFDFVQKHAPLFLEERLKHFKIKDESIFYVQNHPLPQFLVDEILEIFKRTIGEGALAKNRFFFESSFGYNSPKVNLESFSNQITYLQSQMRWGAFTYLNDKSYQMAFNKADVAGINSLATNSKLLLRYFTLVPFFFHFSLRKKGNLPDVEMEEIGEHWNVHF